MKRTCYLHLGISKTGSTSIQSALHNFDDGKTRYADLGAPNHLFALSAFVSTTPRGLSSSREQEFSDVLKADIDRKMHQELVESQNNLIFSSEGLTAGFDPQGAAHLVALLKPHFDRIQAIAYIRDPVSLSRSALQQNIKYKQVRFDVSQLKPAYQKRLSPWIEALGRENVDLVAFDKSTFIGNDLLADFCARVGVEKPDCEGTEIHRNPSLSAEAFAILYCFRHWQGGVPQGDFGGEQHAAVNRLLTYGSTVFAFDAAINAQVLAENAKDIAWIEAQLGKPFRIGSATSGSISFANESDILAYGAALRDVAWAWGQNLEYVDLQEKLSLQKVLRATFYAHQIGGH